SLLLLPRSIEVREPFQARHGCNAPSQTLLLGWSTQRLSSQLALDLRPASLSRACQFASNSLTVLDGKFRQLNPQTCLVRKPDSTAPDLHRRCELGRGP